MARSIARSFEGSNPFLFSCPFTDVMHRLGFDPESCAELASFWWFMGPETITPDDLASVLMSILVPETDAEVEERRSKGRMGIAMPRYRGSSPDALKR